MKPLDIALTQPNTTPLGLDPVTSEHIGHLMAGTKRVLVTTTPKTLRETGNLALREYLSFTPQKRVLGWLLAGTMDEIWFVTPTHIDVYDTQRLRTLALDIIRGPTREGALELMYPGQSGQAIYRSLPAARLENALIKKVAIKNNTLSQA